MARTIAPVTFQRLIPLIVGMTSFVGLASKASNRSPTADTNLGEYGEPKVLFSLEPVPNME